jgi:hypothetical protein
MYRTPFWMGIAYRVWELGTGGLGMDHCSRACARAFFLSFYPKVLKVMRERGRKPFWPAWLVRRIISGDSGKSAGAFNLAGAITLAEHAGHCSARQIVGSLTPTPQPVPPSSRPVRRT